MNSRLDARQRETLRRIADTMLPRAAGMPSASDVGVADELADRLLSLRPELVADLLRALRRAEGREPAAAIADLAEKDAEAYGVLRLVILAAYFLGDSAREAIGYPGQPNLPPGTDDPPSYVANGMLDAVTARGPKWRNAPAESRAGDECRKQQINRRMAMANHVLVVFSNPVPGREAEYNDWQDNVHVPEVLTIPGFVSAQRYCLSGPQFLPADQRPPYITVYQIETDDLAAVYAEAGTRMQSMSFSEALQMETFATHSYTPVGKAHRAK